jgi:hypothetical protein
MSDILRFTEHPCQAEFIYSAKYLTGNDLYDYRPSMPWFGARLRELREARGMTLEQLAKIAKTSVSALSTAEGRMWPPRAETVFKILAGLGVHPHDFDVTFPTPEEYGATGKMSRPAGRPKKARAPVQVHHAVKRQRTGS